MDIYMNRLLNVYDKDYNITGFSVSLYGKQGDNVIKIDISLDKDDFDKGADFNKLTAADIRPVAIKKAISYLK